MSEGGVFLICKSWDLLKEKSQDRRRKAGLEIEDRPMKSAIGWQEEAIGRRQNMLIFPSPRKEVKTLSWLRGNLKKIKRGEPKGRPALCLSPQGQNQQGDGDRTEIPR